MVHLVYDNIIIGGTYAGFGFLCANKGKNLLISKNVYLEDYSPAFKFSKISFNDTNGEKLFCKFDKQGLIRNGYLNLASAAIELYKMAEGKNILYKTYVSDIHDGEITVHNLDGTNNIKCKNVIITQKYAGIREKHFNALVEGNIYEGDFGDYEICKTCFDRQKVLRIRLSAECQMDEARMKLFDIIHKTPGIKLILTAAEFDVRQYENGNELLSCNIENPVESFEKGFRLGEEANSDI